MRNRTMNVKLYVILVFLSTLLDGTVFARAGEAQRLRETQDLTEPHHLTQPSIRLGDLTERMLVDIVAVDVNDERAVVGTGSAPYLHAFDGERYGSWGRDGGGPSELDGLSGLALLEDRVLVLSNNQHKIVSYTLDGEFLAERRIDGHWANRLHVSGGDTLLFTFVPMSDERAVVRLRGERTDTLFTFVRSSESVRLEAAGAPSFTVSLPYTPQTLITPLSDGRSVVWEPGSEQIRVLGSDARSSGEVGSFGPVGAAEPSTDADRTLWIESVLPMEFMGRVGIFDPLKPEVERVAEERFPERLPAVLELLSDPSGGVWVRKTTRAEGQRWAYFGSDGARAGDVVFPPGHRFMAAGPDRLWAWSADDLDVEYVEGFDRPGWAR